MPKDSTRKTRTVLYVGDHRAANKSAVLRAAGFQVLTGFSVDHGVALTVGQRVDVVVLDQEMFIEVGAWSAAQSFKLVNPNTCVLLLIASKILGKGTPRGVDAMVSTRSDKQLVSAVKKLLGE